MDKIEWDAKKYSIGISAMDDEHKVLISLIHALEQNKNDQNFELTERIFSTLDLYIRNHFSHEERMMERMNYTHLSKHKKQHHDFSRSLKNMKAALDKGDHSPKLLTQMSSFLNDWLTRHILTEDKAYADFLTK